MIKELILKRLACLRREMKNAGVKAWYVSGTDPHQSEYLPRHWRTRNFLTGFTGSAGLVVVTELQAALWTDSRYFLQANEQLAGTGIELMKMRVEGTPSPADWLGRILDKGDSVGTDATCLSVNQYKRLNDELQKHQLLLQNTGDLLEYCWPDRDPLPNAPVFEHEMPFAGISRQDKFDLLRNKIDDCQADALLISALDDLAWSFNLRGHDVEFNPVFVGYGLIVREEVLLFVDEGKIPDDLCRKLAADGVKIKPYSAVFDELKWLHGTLLIDPDRTNQALLESLGANVNVSFQLSAPAWLKAIKSEPELKFIRETMRKDGVAMVDFLYWLDQNIGVKMVTEYDLALKLGYFRSLQEGYQGNSFFPIIGYNETGAIVHRSVTPETAHEVKREGMLLFDSGGQYLTGTTDITRTISLARPTEQQKFDFTIVLKGMIHLTQAKFPAGTRGCNLDVLARQAMWQNGMNYGHGTCHGIGYFLNVHEGPMSIRQEYNEHPIEPGMVLSNEPAFYREGQYGLRTENMMVCVASETTEFGRFYGFETLTLCPIDRELIDKNLLSETEIDWINSYHQWCFDELSPWLDDNKKAFLKQLTIGL